MTASSALGAQPAQAMRAVRRARRTLGAHPPAGRGAPGGEPGATDWIPAFAIPRMSTPPKIDGAIDPAEWREAVAVSGVANQADDVLIPRPTTFYLAWDPGHLYFAC